MYKKILSLLLSFLLVFTSMGNAVLAYNSQNIGSNQFVSMLKNKQITKQGLTYLLQTSLSKDELSKLQNGTKEEKTAILKKFLKGGISSSQYNYLQSNGMINLGGVGSNSSGFLQPLQTGVYKVNFKDITPSNYNVVQKEFIGVNNFPKKLVLAEGFSLKIKQDGINKLFEKTNELENKINSLKRQNINIGKVEVKQPKLEIYPGKVVYKKSITIEYNSKEQLENIKRNILEDRLQRGQKPYISNKTISQYGKFVGQEITNSQIEENIKQDCLAETNNTSLCNNIKLDKAKKIWIRTEKIEYPLIVPSLDDVKNKVKLLDVKSMTRGQILQKFKNLAAVKKQYTFIKNEDDGYTSLKEQQIKDVLAQDDYCSSIYEKNTSDYKQCILLQEKLLNPQPVYYSGELLNGFSLGEENRKGVNDSIYISALGYKKKILSYSIYLHYDYGVGLRIPLKVKGTLSKDVLHEADTGANLDFTGKVEVIPFDGDKNFYKRMIGDKNVHDGKEFYLGFGATLETKFRVIGLGGTSINIPLMKLAGYSLMGGSLKDAYNSYKQAVGSCAAKLETYSQAYNNALNNGTELPKMPDCSEQESGVPAKEKLTAQLIRGMINNNYLGFRRDFIPPLGDGQCEDKTYGTIDSFLGTYALGNTNKDVPGCINLMGLRGVEIDLMRIDLYYEITLAITLNLGMDVNIHNSTIKAGCENINSEGFCVNKNITFDNINHKKAIYNGVGVGKIKEDKYKTDKLGNYVKYGPKLSIDYNTDLQFMLVASVSLGLKDIPYIGGLRYTTPEYNIYGIDFNIDLAYHNGTDKYFDMTTKTKLYTKYKTPVKEITKVSIGGDKYTLHYYEYKHNDNRVGVSVFDGLDGKILEVNGSKTWFYLPEQRQNMGGVSVLGQNTNGNVLKQKGSIKTYYTINGSEPRCDGTNGYEYKIIDKKGQFNESQNIIWKTYKRDFEKAKKIKLKVVSCDNLSNQKSKVYTKEVVIFNTHHIPFALHNRKKVVKIPELEIGNNNNTLYKFKLAINTFGGAVSHNSNVNGKTIEYIKYAFVDKDFNPNRLHCNGNIGKIYSGEELSNASAFINDKGLIQGGEKRLVIVKCNTDKPNYTSIPKVYDLKSKVSENSGFAVLNGRIQNIESNLLGEVKGNLGNINGNIGANLNGGVIPGINQTMGYNPQNQNPWENKGFSIPELQEKKPGIQDKLQQGGFSIPELQEKINGQTEGVIKTMNYNGNTQTTLISSDGYVNEKLDEINKCFIDNYNNHLKNIDNTINQFQNTIKTSSEDKVKRKYQRAIDKLNEIKSLFIERYKILINYENLYLPRGIKRSFDGFYIVDADIIDQGCNSNLVPDKEKCILKIGRMYIEPKEGLFQGNGAGPHRGNEYGYCALLRQKKVGGIGNWNIANMNQLEIIYNNKNKLNILTNRYYRASNVENGYISIHMRDGRKSTRTSGFTVCVGLY